ncbi:hypothetical protein C8R42DRAFT_671636 [Lentinula raphanica]|nr:hypothetical protein C8R42DRAFT_671636 [Lentinula raphanica]
MLILGVVSSGVLAAPTLTPRLPTEVEALQSSDSLIGGPRGPVVNMLKARADHDHAALCCVRFHFCILLSPARLMNVSRPYPWWHCMHDQISGPKLY